MAPRSGCWRRARWAGCSALRWKCWSAAGTTTCYRTALLACPRQARRPVPLPVKIIANHHEQSDQEGPLRRSRREEPDVHVHPGELVVSPLGILQRDDRRDGQALPGGTGAQQIAVRLGAVRALPGLLPDVDAGGVAGEQAGI